MIKFVWVNIVFGISILLLPVESFAQYKYEKEYRLSKEEVPTKAQHFFPLEFKLKKMRWFFEENRLGNSIEAKFKVEGQHYSVEFDTLGNLQDIEVKVDKSQVEKNALNSIEQILSNEFDQFKIKKIQKQFVGKSLEWKMFWPKLNLPPQTIKNYEIVLRGKKEKNIKLYEYLFDQQGQMLDKKEIIFRNTDNLEY